MRTALLQITSGEDPRQNAVMLADLVRRAASDGAGFVLTPEVSNIVTLDRSLQAERVTTEDNDPVLAALRDEAARAGVWIALGSIAVKREDPTDPRMANRSFLIDPTGGIVARYDKIHMFDVNVTAEETFRESAAFRPGEAAVVADTPFARLGLTVCYDLRFAHLYRALAHAGAEVLLIPAAFSPVTGAAHWEPLLRARAIENGAWVLATAQTGTHPTAGPRARRTHGHSLVVSPWGEVLSDAGVEPGVTFVTLDRSAVREARSRVPAIDHDRPFTRP